MFSAGTTHRFGWSDPQGYVADYYDVWFSSNGGSSWSLAGGHLTTRSFAWLVPATPPASALLEVAAMDSQGIMGSWISQIFDVVSSPTGVEDQSALPREYALRMRGANPLVAGRTRFELTLPKPGAVTVRVYDVTGRFIRELSRRSLPAGYHGLSWDAKDAAGRPVGSGIYFLRADAAGKRMDLRLAIVR